MPESKRKSAIRETANELKDRFENNPFLDEMAMVVRTKHIKRKVPGVMAFDNEAQMEKPVFYHGTRNIDTEPFIKLFEPMWPYLCCMTRPGLLVLSYVCSQLKPGNSIVLIDRDEFVAKGHGRHTYYGGLDELISFNLLARTEKLRYYWINPALFFNGNRVHMTHDFPKPKKAQPAPKPNA